MTYRRPSNIEGGVIIVDAILALALAALFVSVIATASETARGSFDLARDRSALLDAYEAHASDFDGMAAYQSRSRAYPPVSLQATARLYGNDLVETDITVGYAGEGGAIASTAPTVEFARIGLSPTEVPSDTIGTPLCSPDLGLKATVGSYAFMHDGSDPQGVPTIAPITLPIDPLLPLTGMAVRDGIAYVSADSSAASDPDLLVADIHDLKHPSIVSSLNTGPGIRAIALAGSYIFAAADSSAAELHVIRLTGPGPTLALAKKYRLPLPTASSSAPVGSSIFYDKGVVYLGTEKWDGDEISAIDVSIPESPAAIGGYDTNSKVNGISVHDGMAYSAESDQDQLRSFSVDVSGSLQPADSFSPSGWQRQVGEAVTMFEGSVIFGRTSGGYDIASDHELFSWPSGTSGPAGISSPAASLDIPGGVYGIVADRHRIYAVTRTVGRELSIFDRTLGSSTAAYYPLPVAPQTITCDEDHLYILSHTAPVIYEVSF